MLTIEERARRDLRSGQGRPTATGCGRRRTPKTIRRRNGNGERHDGPYAETARVDRRVRSCWSAPRIERGHRGRDAAPMATTARSNCVRSGRSSSEGRRPGALQGRAPAPGRSPSVASRSPRPRRLPPRRRGAATTLVGVTERAPLSQKLTAIAESATLKVDAKAKALQADGRPVISLRRRRARLRDARSTSSRPRSRRCATRRTTATRPRPACPTLREAIAAKTLRDSGLEVDASPGRRDQRRQAGRLPGVPGAARPGRRGARCPTPYWTTYPEAIALAGGVPVDVFAGADQELPRHGRAARGRPHRAHQGAALRVAVEPDRRGVLARADAGDRRMGARARHLGHLRRDLPEPRLRGRRARSRSSRRCPELADQTILVNGVAKTYAMTGWRLGWMVGPADVIKVAANLQSHLSSQRDEHLAARRDRRADRPAGRGRGDAPAPSTAAGAADRRRALEDRRRHGAEPAGRVLRVPRRARACSAASGAASRPTTSLELADLILEQAEVAVVPGEAFGPSGYLRLSYALGDEPLLEGVRRLQELFA